MTDQRDMKARKALRGQLELDIENKLYKTQEFWLDTDKVKPTLFIVANISDSVIGVCLASKERIDDRFYIGLDTQYNHLVARQDNEVASRNISPEMCQTLMAHYTANREQYIGKLIMQDKLQDLIFDSTVIRKPLDPNGELVDIFVTVGHWLFDRPIHTTGHIVEGFDYQKLGMGDSFMVAVKLPEDKGKWTVVDYKTGRRIGRRRNARGCDCRLL